MKKNNGHYITVKGFEFILCDKSLELFKNFKWRLCVIDSNHVYLRRNFSTGSIPRQRTEMFHRKLMDLNFGDKLQVDHINGNTLDNRISNLRVVSPDENYRNRMKHKKGLSKYIGVSVGNNKNKKWKAYVRKDGKMKHIGYFNTEIEAAIARDKEASIQYGIFTKLNFPN